MKFNKKSCILLLIGFVCLVKSTKGEIKTFSLQNRISGGNNAVTGQFPHQVGVQTHRFDVNQEDYTAFCGGSLISEFFVLTAAHCLYDGIRTEIFLGATNFTGYWIKMDVDKPNMIVHEKFNPNETLNDIALAKLPRRAPLSKLIKIINLPRSSQRQSTFERNVGWILGWGRLGDSGRKRYGSPNLQYARRWILPNEYCDYHYPHYKPNTQMCVDGSHGISACPGDSGGPVFIEDDDGTRTIVGIASYERYEGCEKDFPVVYTRVTSYLDWIVKNTGISLRD